MSLSFHTEAGTEAPAGMRRSCQSKQISLLSAIKKHRRFPNWKRLCISARCMPEAFLGLTKTLRRQSFGEQQRLVIVTVGLADPDILQNRENIRNALQKQIPAQLYGRAAVFHLRGAIDYQALSLGHRTMMRRCTDLCKRNRRKNGTKKTGR